MGIHTLHVEHVMLLAIYTVLTVANSLTYKTTRGIHWFSLYSVSALLGACAVMLRGSIPDFVSIVIGNLFVVAGYFFFFLSLSDLFGRKRSQMYVQLSFLALAVITMLQYGLIHPNTKTRLIAFSIVLGLQQAHTTLVVTRPRDRALRRACAPIAIMLGLLCLSNITRIAGVFYYGAPADYLKAGAFLGWFVIINSCLQCGAMVGYVWMTAALLHEELEVQASTDSLTGLLNRRAIERRADPTIASCLLAKSPVCAILIDLDGFKHINDTFGHSCGDFTLIEVSACLQRHMRRSDLLARLGGDEFAVLLPDTPLEAAYEITERLRRAVAALEIDCGNVNARVTASFGLSEAHRANWSWEKLALSCDHAMYEAKRAGGNLAIPAAEFA